MRCFVSRTSYMQQADWTLSFRCTAVGVEVVKAQKKKKESAEQVEKKKAGEGHDKRKEGYVQDR